MLIVGVSGPQWVGKSTVASYLVRTYNAWVFDSSWVRELVVARGLPLERASYDLVSGELRAARGPGFVADELLERLPNPRPRLVIHEGLRWVGVAHRHREFPPFRHIHLTASVETRFARACGVSKNGRRPIQTIEEFLAEERLPSELEIPELEPLADMVLSAESNQMAMLCEIHAWVGRWLHKSSR